MGRGRAREWFEQAWRDRGLAEIRARLVPLPREPHREAGFGGGVATVGGRSRRAHLFEGGKEALRPIYDRLVVEAAQLGPDVEIAPKKANASVRRGKQFALIQPSTRTRVDLGLILPGRDPQGRLEPSGSFNAMFTHRVKLASADEIDREVLTWLREAYDAAN